MDPKRDLLVGIAISPEAIFPLLNAQPAMLGKSDLDLPDIRTNVLVEWRMDQRARLVELISRNENGVINSDPMNPCADATRGQFLLRNSDDSL